MRRAVCLFLSLFIIAEAMPSPVLAFKFCRQFTEYRADGSNVYFSYHADNGSRYAPNYINLSWVALHLLPLIDALYFIADPGTAVCYEGSEKEVRGTLHFERYEACDGVSYEYGIRPGPSIKIRLKASIERGGFMLCEQEQLRSQGNRSSFADQASGCLNRWNLRSDQAKKESLRIVKTLEKLQDEYGAGGVRREKFLDEIVLLGNTLCRDPKKIAPRF